MSGATRADRDIRTRWPAASPTLRIGRIAFIGLLLAAMRPNDPHYPPHPLPGGPDAGIEPNTVTAPTSYGVVSMQVHGFCAGHTNADMVRLIQASVAGRRDPAAEDDALARPMVVWHISSRPGRLKEVVIRADLLKHGVTVGSVSIIIPEIETEQDAPFQRLLRATLTRLMGANPA
jgi:hypothetical protein